MEFNLTLVAMVILLVAVGLLIGEMKKREYI